MNIIDLPDGEQITEPGAYRCSMKWYHSQDICPGPSISSSGIRTAVLKSPHAFWMSSDLNEMRYPEKDPGEGLILGRAAHALILGDEVFDEHFVYVPEDAPQRPTATQIKAFERDGKWSENAKPRAEWWEEFDARAAGKHEVTAEQIRKIKFMAENLAKSPEAVENLTGSLTEISLIWQDERTGLWIKSRPDCIPDNGCDFADLKTFAPKGADLTLAAMRAITDMGYPMQGALAIEGAEHVLGMTASSFMLVFIQTSEPYEPIPIEVDEESLYWARVLNRKGIDDIAHGLKTGEWPFRTKEIVKYSYPPSMLNRFGQMQLDGEIPNIERAA